MKTNTASNILALAIIAIYGGAAFYAGHELKTPVVVTKQVFVDRPVPVYAQTKNKMNKKQFDAVVASINASQLQ